MTETIGEYPQLTEAERKAIKSAITPHFIWSGNVASCSKCTKVIYIPEQAAVCEHCGAEFDKCV